MADPDDAATTGQKTHRYLRLSLVFVVFALLVSVAIQTVVASWEPFRLGWNLLPSISHYFYTPARDVFVGALIAAALALLALSGRDRTTVLLDVAAVFAPLIALVPTGIDPRHPIGDLTCPGTTECVPAVYLDDVRAGVAAYAVVVPTLVVTMAVIRRRRGIVAPGTALVSAIAIGTAALMAGLAFLPGIRSGFPLNVLSLPGGIHFAVTLIFFAIFAIVPILHARSTPDTSETPPTARQRRAYRWIAGLMIADLVMLIAVLLLHDALGHLPLVLVGETVALLLFAWFWSVQTFQRWGDANPPSIV
ncbi:hypothetical protein [Microbacterium sp. 179-I 3D3 NHS]|uniref:hypothetical protein n=1 Tax=Microbacterium sp. 179-I 3D3 NHS TaxID=3142382 RepID=UPI00399FD457